MIGMENSNYLSFLRPSQEALILYRDQVELDHILFEHVKSGLQQEDKAIYVAGTRSTSEVQTALYSCGIDVDDQTRKRNLIILTYDDLCLVNGVLDIQTIHDRLSSITKRITKDYPNRSVRLVTESDWWLLADVFEKAMEIEETHPRLPPNISSICTYRLRDLLDYARIYHLAKLIELHRHALWVSSLEGPIMHRNRLLSDINGVILSSIRELELPINNDVSKTNIELHSPSDIVSHIKDQNEVAELESIIERRLRRILDV
jgi:hypothetical protein